MSGATVAWWKRHRDGSIEVNESRTFLAEDALVTGRRPLVFGDTAPAPVAQPYIDGSSFESWFASLPVHPEEGDKQRARDAYAAGMCDPLVHPAPVAQGEPVAWMHPNGRVVPAETMTAARRDGGAMASSLRDYKIAPGPLAAPAPVAPSVRCAPERDPEEELNCAEEVLDALAVDLGLFDTVFDCIGDYITAVVTAIRAAPAPVAQGELLAALREIADDYADRFDLDSPSTNPGIKFTIEQARSVLTKIEATSHEGGAA